MDLYEFPRLYDVLKRPDDEDVALVRRLVRQHVGAPPGAVLDPACGPGNWLAPFAGDGARVVGNDFNRHMVEFARARLGPGAQVEHGDMYELAFGPGRFDLIFEASGVTSLVPSPERLGGLLSSLARMLTPRGVLLFLFHFDDPREEGRALPLELWRSGWRALAGGGEASLTYSLLDYDRGIHTQTIRRRVEVRGAADLPAELEQSYPMRIWRQDEIARALEVAGGVELCGNHHVDGLDGTHENGERWRCERYLVFRRKA